MNIEQLIDQFKLVTDTEEGLEQLRKVILNQAVRGNLTKQDPGNEPANKLLERINADKKRLYDEGEIRKPKTYSDLKTKEIPFEIPKKWKWIKFGSLGITQTGTTPKTSINKYYGEFIPFLGPGDLSNGEIDYSNRALSKIGLEEGRLISKSSIIMVCIGGSIGKCNIVDRDVSCNQQINTIYPLSNINPKLINEFIKADFFQSEILNRATGSATPIINKTKWENMPFPLPPLEEQQCIIQKIESLFAQVDELEQKMQQDQEFDERLQVAILDDLQSAETPEVSQQSWQRLTEHFEQIYRKPEHIDQLKQAILNEAVRGRLVPQNPNDEPAEKLLVHIKKEKQRLYEEGEIRKPKDLDPITEEEIPYDLPKGWCWERLGNLVILERGRSKHRPRNADKLFKNGTYPFIQTGDIANSIGQITEYSKKYNEVGLKQSKLWAKGTLCITIAANIADTGILGIDACFPDSIVGLLPVIKPDETVKFYEYFIQNLQSDLEEFAPSTAQKNINLTILNTLFCPVPPLEEQIRIVGRVRKLFAWCDNLKEKMIRFQQTDHRLLEALVNKNGN